MRAKTGESLYCLDSYALVEIRVGNKNFSWVLSEEFFICELTLCEFFGVLYKETNFEEAQTWFKKLEPFAMRTPLNVLAQAVKFRFDNKKSNFSFFDAVGYLTAIHFDSTFVTGDKEFKLLPHVKFVK
ncbi:MAG: PIN domain-containing protein [Candidatus Diapherotrites archaeon]|nr:PIN domain-containing protein [Candidatus Diapherotrites archaeon]